MSRSDGAPALSPPSVATRKWLGDAAPPPPASFRPWLDGESEASPITAGEPRRGESTSGLPERVSELARLGEAALRATIRKGGTDRGSAFLLLEADALITYACEAAADAPDPEEALSEVLGAVGGAGR